METSKVLSSGAIILLNVISEKRAIEWNSTAEHGVGKNKADTGDVFLLPCSAMEFDSVGNRAIESNSTALNGVGKNIAGAGHVF